MLLVRFCRVFFGLIWLGLGCNCIWFSSLCLVRIVISIVSMRNMNIVIVLVVISY